MSQRATYQTENETQNIVINVVSSTQVKVGNLNVTKKATYQTEDKTQIS